MMPEEITNDGDEDILQEGEDDEADDIEEADDEEED
jgi:hypothetical protein